MSDFRLDFVGVGPQRTGSTWLDRVLRAHPSLCLPENVKETKFFDQHFGKGLDWYAWHYQNCGTDNLFGEVGPTYFDHKEVPCRIHAHNPSAKIIVGLRDPASRAFSLYRHHRREGRVSSDFSEAVRQIPRIVDAGHYARHIPRWLNLFGQNQILFVVLDDVKERPEWTTSRICDFLGIEVIQPPVATKRVNSAAMPRFPRLSYLAVELAKKLRGKRMHRLVEWGKELGLKEIIEGKKEEDYNLKNPERARLVEEHEEDIKFVEKMLDRNLSEWRSS